MLAKRSEGLQVSDMPALEGPVNPKLDGRKIHHVSLLGGASNHHLEKYVDDNGKDDIPYEMENKSHVPNHQPDDIYPNQLIYI